MGGTHEAERAGRAGRSGPHGGGTPGRRTTIEARLASARAALDRVTAEEAYREWGAGAVLVDTRIHAQRAEDGTVPGALVIERNHLEWRCDPASGASVPQAVDTEVRWIVLCDEGYASSLAAASLRSLGLRRATDLIGGFQSWRAAGLPVTPPDQAARRRAA
ncbi:Rhodanese-related sulfurtransferase [Streptomyces zhaozhouensis]|uniref:Rhodanese-related sulfurtransferase n=1 Tax=Streptomyces zhaozhouensis TaxID=1300267 RepID=A0A286DZ15_9ACTN|nr:rhodanese-like domain-containing protein [Streptomyces zhaozhouensis]SOD63891.1 Rhodanese-related sulfurtransferase [Streptomyces zhaozhouensis]